MCQQDILSLTMHATAKSPESSLPSRALQRDHAYGSLRRLLILQQIPQGQRLREPEWARKLHVNRTALREAFARLEAEGFIERGPLTGYFVPRLSQSDLAEINKLRIALECLAIDEICAGARELHKRLRPAAAACDEFEQFLDRDYPLGVCEADRRFHEALIQAAGLKRLALLYQRAPLPMISGDIEHRPVWSATCRMNLSEHRQLLAALQKRSDEKAKTILRRHLSRQATVPICH